MMEIILKFDSYKYIFGYKDNIILSRLFGFG
jgi:hypothetical protein